MRNLRNWTLRECLRARRNAASRAALVSVFGRVCTPLAPPTWLLVWPAVIVLSMYLLGPISQGRAARIRRIPSRRAHLMPCLSSLAKHWPITPEPARTAIWYFWVLRQCLQGLPPADDRTFWQEKAVADLPGHCSRKAFLLIVPTRHVMALRADEIIDRRRLRRKLTFWRIAAIGVRRCSSCSVRCGWPATSSAAARSIISPR